MMMPILSMYEKAAQQGLRDIARATLKLSNEKIPKDTEETADSGFTRVDDLTAQVGYTSPVAPLQHENLDNKHPNGGEAKFLERAAEEIDAAAIMAKRMRKLQSGG